MRAPVLPPLRWLAMGLSLLGLVMGLANGLWAQAQDPGLNSLFLWTGLGVASTLIALAAHPFLGQGVDAGPLQGPTGWAWARFWLAFGLLAAVGCVLRALGALAWADAPMQLWAQVSLWLGHGVAVLVLVGYVEHEAALREACLRQDEANQAQIERLFAARASLVRGQLRQQHELWVLLSEGVAPTLAQLRLDLAGLVAMAEAGARVPQPEAQAWQGRLDAFREGAVRQLSQLLHPSVLLDGLLPTLRALVKAYEAHALVRWTMAPEAQARLAQALPDAWALGFYRIVEALLDQGLRQGPAGPLVLNLACEGEALVLALRGGAQALVQGLSRQDPSLALLDSRVALMGAQWELTPGPTGEAAWCLRLPLPAIAKGPSGQAQRAAWGP